MNLFLDQEFKLNNAYLIDVVYYFSMRNDQKQLLEAHNH